MGTIIKKHNKMTKSHTFKCTMVGDANTGKTALLNQLSTSTFDPEYDVSIEFQNTTKCTIIDGNQVCLDIVDAPGFKIFKDQVYSHLFKTKAVATFIVYDVTNRLSFDNTLNWLNAVKKHCMKNERIMLVANKTDLDNRDVTIEEGLIFAKQNGLLYCETNANLSATVQVCFEAMVKAILKDEALVKKCKRAEDYEVVGDNTAHKVKKIGASRPHKRNLLEMIFGRRN